MGTEGTGELQYSRISYSKILVSNAFGLELASNPGGTNPILRKIQIIENLEKQFEHL